MTSRFVSNADIIVVITSQYNQSMLCCVTYLSVSISESRWNGDASHFSSAHSSHAHVHSFDYDSNTQVEIIGAISIVAGKWKVMSMNIISRLLRYLIKKE